MIPINGNTTAHVQTKTSNGKNPVGENIEVWTEAGNVLGWLDYTSGDNNVSQYNAKIQDTTHMFFCDYQKWIPNIDAEHSRFIINDEKYDVLMIDDPMGMHQHLEIYLKYVGGGLGV